MLLLAIAGMSLGTFAQETTTTEIPTQKHKVVTNGFWDNWFIDFGGDYISNYSNQEVGVSGNPFICDRGNWGFHVAVGKWATPSFGMRAKIGAAWGTQVNGPESSLVDNEVNPLYNQVVVTLEPMINLHNLFAGYKPRVWNTIAYASVGYGRHIAHNNCEGVNSAIVGAGWLNTFNVTKRFHINVDIYGRMGRENFDGAGQNIKGDDWQVGWSVGFGVNLGKVGWDNAPDVDAIMAMNKAQLAALNASLAEQQAENERLQKLIKNHKCPEAKQVTEIITSKASVFFNINKSKIASKKDLVNVKELAESAKANGKTIVVTGYADSKTGSAEYNQKLSERRAKAVADELVKMGVDSDKIEVVGKGGVEELSPISYNRRVVVSLK